MSVPRYSIGILFSAHGSYGSVGRTMLNGALLGCREANAEAQGAIEIVPLCMDPGSRLEAYTPAVESLLASGARNIVGCYTSSSRKEVIPTFEKNDALLWYPAHYEGFESNNNVIYTGSSPNHHMLPLVEHLVTSFGKACFCVGSNYIWAWESNRVMREELMARKGVVQAERYLAVGDTDVEGIVEAIFAAEPDFIFNSLIGESAYAFFRVFRRACDQRGIDQKTRFPIASCNLSEPELAEIGPEAVDGHLSSSVYFASLDTAENRTFISQYEAAFPDGPGVSAEAEAAYIAVRLLARSLLDAGTDEIGALRESARRQGFLAPQGHVSIDPETFHTWLTPRIGRSRSDGRFDIVAEARGPVRPDPYLVRSAATIEPAAPRPVLRIVA